MRKTEKKNNSEREKASEKEKARERERREKRAKKKEKTKDRKESEERERESRSPSVLWTSQSQRDHRHHTQFCSALAYCRTSASVNIESNAHGCKVYFDGVGRNSYVPSTTSKLYLESNAIYNFILLNKPKAN